MSNKYFKTLSKQELANKIWNAANELRKNLEAYKYKDFILSFLFYSFLSQKQIDYMLNDLGLSIEEISKLQSNYNLLGLPKKETDEIETQIDEIKRYLGYFIFYNDLYQVWTTNKYGQQIDFSINNMEDAFNRFNKNIYQDYKYQNLFRDIIITTPEDLNNLGSNKQEQTKNAKKLMEQMNEIPVTKQNYDVLGYVYEFLIGKFASTAGKKGGEFYTPHEVSILMSDIISYNFKDRDRISIYDPTSGSGSLLLNIGEAFKKYGKDENSVTYYAQEITKATFNLTRMNLIMKNINSADINVRNGDTLEEDWPTIENGGNIISVDAVVSNPPYSQHWRPEGKENDPRYNEYGLAPKSKADYAFLLHELYHLATNGVMAIVLPHGVLFRGGSEKEIRRKLIENQKIETIIGLPANIFFGTGIATIIMILKKNKSDSNIQFIDASKLFIKDGKNNKLESSHIKKITDAYKAKTDIANFSRVVSLQEIKDNDFNLNISRYIDNFEKEDTYDLYASMFGGIPLTELKQLNDYWNTFDSLFNQLTTKVNDAYYNLIPKEKISEATKDNLDVKNYQAHFKQIVTDFKDLTNSFATSVDNIKKIKDIDLDYAISNYVFEKLNDIPLLDKYELFQILLDYVHKNIKPTIDIINEYVDADFKVLIEETTEIETTKNEKISKLESHLINIDVISENYFVDLNNKIKDLNEEISNLDSQISSILETIDEEDKNDSLFGKTGDFKFPEISKYLKKADKNQDEESFEYKLFKADDLNNQKVSINKQLKERQQQLFSAVANFLQNISEEQFLELIKIQWNNNFEDIIFEKHNVIINNLISKLETLSDKYFDTLSDINNQIAQKENELIELLSDLKGEESDMQGISELIKILGNK
ncbi:type I restriction-modification system subunit M [Mycoplasma sp. 246B]